MIIHVYNLPFHSSSTENIFFQTDFLKVSLTTKGKNMMKLENTARAHKATLSDWMTSPHHISVTDRQLDKDIYSIFKTYTVFI